MKRSLPALLFSLVALLAPSRSAAAQDKPANSAAKEEEKIARIQRLIATPLKEIDGFQEGMPLEKFLVALVAKVPGGKKLLFRIDAQAFGEQLPLVAGATVKIPRLINVSLVTVLRRALSQVDKVEVDYGIQPTGVIITRPRLAVHRALYDIRDVVREMPLLLPHLQEPSGKVYQLRDPADGPALLVLFLMNEVNFRPWETIEILNGSRLAVIASPTRHQDVDYLIGSLLRLTDRAVVMNARLYEVDRAFFKKHVAPLFARDKDAEDRPGVVRIEGPLFKKISRQKLLLESDNARIRPGEEAAFLSRQSIFRFAAGPHPKKPGRTLTGTGLAGVSFEVRPIISRDGRYLRLQISQNVAQLVRIDKAKTLDVHGKEIEVESPNLGKTFATGTVQIPDGAPLLMPVAYRPPGKGSEDKVWLLLARPFIWIEEEVEIIRKGGKDFSPRSVWDSEVPKEEKPAPVPVPPLPATDEVKAILQAIIADVLTNPELKDIREFYGTAKDRTFTLIDGEKIGWPSQFRPRTHAYKQVEVQEDPFVDRRRVLGIRLDTFNLKQKKVEPLNTVIEICLFNAGGSANGSVIGGCTISYAPRRIGKGWTVKCVGVRDP